MNITLLDLGPSFYFHGKLSQDLLEEEKTYIFSEYEVLEGNQKINSLKTFFNIYDEEQIVTKIPENFLVKHPFLRMNNSHYLKLLYNQYYTLKS